MRARLIAFPAAAGALLAIGASFYLRSGGVPRSPIATARPTTGMPEWAIGKLEWESETAVALGYVCAGTKLSHTFRFKNVSSETLRITGAETGCPTCSKVVCDHHIIDPATAFGVSVSADIDADINAERSFRVDATVSFDSHSDPIRMTLYGTAFRPVPTVVDFGRVTESSPVERLMMIRNCDLTPPSISSIKAENEAVAVTDVTLPTATSGRQLRFVLTPAALSGNFNSFVRIRTSGSVPAEAAILVRAFIVPAIEVTPPSVSLGTGLPEVVRRAELTLSGTDGVPFDVLEIKCPAVFISVVYRARNASRGVYDLNVVTGNPLPVGQVQTALEVLTTHPRAPRITIPVIGLVEQPKTPIAHVGGGS